MKIKIESIHGLDNESEVTEDQITLLYNPNEDNPMLGVFYHEDTIQLILNPWKIEKYQQIVKDSNENRKRQLDVSVSDDVTAKESLVNHKPWFNGMKTFSSVKVNPAPLKDPNVLEINIVDNITADTGLV